MKAADIKLNYTYRVRVGKQILSLRVDSIETLPHVGKSPPKFKYECTDLKHGKRHTILTPNNFIEDVVRPVLAGDHVTVFKGKHADGIGLNTVYLVKRVDGKSVVLAIRNQEVKVPVASVKLTNEPLAVEQPPVIEAKKVGGKRGSILGQIRIPSKSSGEKQEGGDDSSDPTSPANPPTPATSRSTTSTTTPHCPNCGAKDMVIEHSPITSPERTATCMQCRNRFALSTGTGTLRAASTAKNSSGGSSRVAKEGEQGSDPTSPDSAASTAPKPLESSSESTTSSEMLRSQMIRTPADAIATNVLTVSETSVVDWFEDKSPDEMFAAFRAGYSPEDPPPDGWGTSIIGRVVTKVVKVSRTPTDWEVELADGDMVVITAISEPMAIGKARKQGLTLHPRYDSQACSKCLDTPVGADCPVCGRIIPATKSIVIKQNREREWAVDTADGGTVIITAETFLEATRMAESEGYTVQWADVRSIPSALKSKPWMEVDDGMKELSKEKMHVACLSMDDTPKTLPQKSKLGARLEQNRKDEDVAPHLIVEARAGTGKTTTLVEGIKRVLGLPSPLTPSPQQAAVWDCMELSKGKVKTIAFVAFNNNIAKELKDRVPSGVAAMTNHSMGFATVKERFGKNIKVEKNRTHELIATVLGRDYRELKGKEFEFLQQVASLVDLCKMNLVIRPDNSLRTGLTHDEQLDELISHYDIEIADRSKVYPVIPEVLNLAMHPERDGMIDFADMIWLPVVLDLPMPKYDMLLVDEAQDLNRCQQALVKKAGKRFILCGDPKQAIFGFCGADAQSMDRMYRELDERHPLDFVNKYGAGTNGMPMQRGCVRLPLTVTRRCGKAIVEEAKKIVPDFEAFHTNCEGKVSRARYSVEKPTEAQRDRPQSADSIAPAMDMIPVQDYRASVRDGDFVICRVNAPLVSQCFRFLKEGRKATIRGRSIGDGLKKLVKDLKASDVTDLVAKLSDWRSQELKKEQAKRFPSEDRIIAVGDKYDCLLAFTEGFKEVHEVLGRIEQIFTDDKQGGIILSSVHKVKGLEANRVFFLMPKGGECPHPMAKSDWQREQELNIKYVGITRAIEELIIVS